MKKNLIYFSVVIILALLAYFFVFNKREGSYKAADSEFAVTDTNTIGKIFIADMRGDKITLERKEDHWIVNDITKARPESIVTLLRTIAQIKVDIPVANTMRNSVIKNMAAENIKVEIYNLENKKIRSYYVGKPNINYKGNFLLMDESDVPFIVNIPGYDGIISTRYTTDIMEWKSRNIFNDAINTITEITVQYPKIPDSSFTILKNTEGAFALQGRTGFNPEITKYFASQFKNVNCENYIIDNYKLDSLKLQQPVCIISTKNTAGETHAIKIYYRPVTYRTKLQFTYEGEEINFDLDKFYGLMHEDNDLAVIQNFVFGKFLVGPNYFYRQRPTNKNVLIDAMMEDARKKK
ncbi:MAG: hypothetical protein H7Y00_16515 [Fimbriimonadaceae bacterium]|nr:hypothetical protein [Chitinophagales bacterium]